MRLGVTGHQDRVGIDWTWTRARVDEALGQFPLVTEALTSLAAGTDTVFAEACFARGIAVTAVVPLEGYERFFDGLTLETYRKLLASAKAVQLPGSDDEEQAFLAAGRYVVDRCDVLIAVWDEQPAAGLGGTADVVAYARDRGRPIRLINPLTRTIASFDGKHS